MTSKLVPILLIILVVLVAGCAGVNPADDQPIESQANQSDSADANSETGNSTARDTDGDGIRDSVEKEQYNTDPTKVDTDDDGLNDSEEIELGTDPLAADTDGDGLNDSREIDLETDPLTVDSDGDGLNDSREVALGTEPTTVDTDGDSLPDGFEVKMDDEYANADPLHKDIFVQVDYVDQLESQKEDEIKDEFANAPISNPDDESGINLHIDYSSELTCEPGPSANTDGVGSRIEYPCETDTGETSSEKYPAHYYVRIVEKVNTENQQVDKINGVVLNDQTAFVSNSGSQTAGTFMHELGHLLQLNHPRDPDAHRSFSEYPSIMTYEAPAGELQFADEDWEVIEQRIQSTPRLYVGQEELTEKVKNRNN